MSPEDSPSSNHLPDTRRTCPRIGLQINTTQRPFRWSDIRQLAVTAEELGFDSLWTEDHLYYQGPTGEAIGPWEAWTTLGALAEASKSIRLGTMVTPIAMRRPVMVAHEAATIDEISGGRLVLGLGAGWNRDEFDAVGADFEPRFSRFAEALSILMDLFESGDVAHKGEHYQVEASLEPRPSVRPRPELMIGSLGPKMLHTALPHVDGWNWDGFTLDLPHFEKSTAGVSKICRELGRDPATVWRSAHLVASLEGALGLPVNLPEDDELLGGSAEQLADGLRRCAEAGMDEVMLIVDPPTPEALETLARAAALAGAG